VDPEVLFRPKQLDENSKKILFRTLRASEVLLKMNEKPLSASVLKSQLSAILKTEIPFQLYSAVFFQRAGDLASSFQILGCLVRADPNLLSRSILQLLYPLEQFDQIKLINEDADPYLILALVRQESAFDVSAKSSAGAQGLMQLQWPTAKAFERVTPKQLWEPRVNLRVGVKYFKKLEKRFQGRLDYTLAAYNAGPERIKNWALRYPVQDALLFLDLLPLQETRDYVSSIARNYFWYRRLYANFGGAESRGQDSLMDHTGPNHDGERLLRTLGAAGF
jgi:hypothetical protein